MRVSSICWCGGVLRARLSAFWEMGEADENRVRLFWGRGLGAGAKASEHSRRQKPHLTPPKAARRRSIASVSTLFRKYLASHITSVYIPSKAITTASKKAAVLVWWYRRLQIDGEKVASRIAESAITSHNQGFVEITLKVSLARVHVYLTAM